MRRWLEIIRRKIYYRKWWVPSRRRRRCVYVPSPFPVLSKTGIDRNWKFLTTFELTTEPLLIKSKCGLLKSTELSPSAYFVDS